MREFSRKSLRWLRIQEMEVFVLPDGACAACVHSPTNRRSRAVRMAQPRKETEVLLILSESHFKKDPKRILKNHLRENLGKPYVALIPPEPFGVA